MSVVDLYNGKSTVSFMSLLLSILLSSVYKEISNYVDHNKVNRNEVVIMSRVIINVVKSRSSVSPD